MKINHNFTEEVIIRDIIERIKIDEYSVKPYGIQNKNEFITLNSLADSFEYPEYSELQTNTYTSQNPMSYYIFLNNKNSFYFVLRKLIKEQENEILILFYIDDNEFNIMKCSLVAFEDKEHAYIWKELSDVLNLKTKDLKQFIDFKDRMNLFKGQINSQVEKKVEKEYKNLKIIISYEKDENNFDFFVEDMNKYNERIIAIEKYPINEEYTISFMENAYDYFNKKHNIKDYDYMISLKDTLSNCKNINTFMEWLDSEKLL